MSVNTSIAKDKKKRRFYLKWEFTDIRLKFLLRQNNLLPHELNFLHFKLFKSLKWIIPVSQQLNNRCNITGKASAPYRYFKLSRMTLKNFASNGILPGIRKSAW